MIPRRTSERGRFLITTADERSWRRDRPLVFLGEWCRQYERREHWENLDAVVATPFCPVAAKRDAATARVTDVASTLLAELAAALNHRHGLQGDLRFWRILLGHWLHRVVGMLFHRWHAVQGLLDEHEISSSIVFASPQASLASADTDRFIWACNDPHWNNRLIGDLLSRVWQVPVEFVATPVTDEYPLRAAAVPGSLQRLLRRMQRNSDALIHSTYLPRAVAIDLCLRLRQVPQQYHSPVAPALAADPAARAVLRQQDASDSSSGAPDFERYARHMVFELLPTCFLEGFAELRRSVDALDWPARPRFIFTSNGFDTDEAFKLWTALRVQEGAAYFIGQHGNNYGTARYCTSELECLAISDAFLTWGWSEGRNTVPAFIFKTAGRRQAYASEGGLVLMELCLPHRLMPWDPYPEFAIYQEQQFEFVAALPDSIRDRLTVRLHAEFRRQPWCEESRWRDREPMVRLDPGLAPAAQLLSECRLVVHSYDSTGILETLALGVPTLCFWSGELEHVRQSARPYYTMLADAGILHFSPRTAARHVARIWDDVDGWWSGESVVAARRAFCMQFARSSSAPASELAALLAERTVQ